VTARLILSKSNLRAIHVDTCRGFPRPRPAVAARDDGRLVAIDTATKDGAMVQHATVRVEYGLQARTLGATVQHFGVNVSRRSATPAPRATHRSITPFSVARLFRMASRS
jgi:hypothetical protein